MPRRKISFFICFLFLGFTCYAQQNNIWYFGKNAGLDFNSRAGQPIPSVLLNSAMFAEEGCSAVSNTDGDLLFYTNGNKIYNRRHQLMLNGDNLAGNISACQSSIIIPMPGNENLFYVFTTDAIQNNKNDLIRPVLGERFVLKEFTIYNRWGQRIFATSQQNKGWNGKIAGLEQDSGVYIWTLHAIDTRTDKRVDKKGTFILLR